MRSVEERLSSPLIIKMTPISYPLFYSLYHYSSDPLGSYSLSDPFSLSSIWHYLHNLVRDLRTDPVLVSVRKSGQKIQLQFAMCALNNSRKLLPLIKKRDRFHK